MSMQDTPVADMLPESVSSALPAAAKTITEKQATELNTWLKTKDGPIPVEGVTMADIDALANAFHTEMGNEGPGIAAAGCCCCSIVCSSTASAQTDSIRSRSII